MEAITWIERITDETNPWLIAIKKEEEGDLLMAFDLFLKDAGECLRQGATLRAALSCSCAADCLAKMGKLSDSQVLISETAKIYRENADSVIGRSVREALWSLREAYEYFYIAGDSQAAQEVQKRIARLVSRVDPSAEGDALTQTLRPKPPLLRGKDVKKAIKFEGSTLIAESIEEFLRLRRSGAVPETRPTPSKGAAAPRRRVRINEESVISQLG